MEMTSNSNKILLMGLIGFAAGILMAPDKGTVTRDKLKHKADDLAEKAKVQSNKARDKLRDFRSKSDPDEAVKNENIEHLVP